MALTRDALIQHFPVLWHLTSRANWARIIATRRLESAAALMRAAGDEQWLERRRPAAVPLALPEGTVWLRDQEPLHEGAARFEGGWDFPRLVREINRRVYFWPGDHRGPARKARGNFDAFRARPEAIALRLPTAGVCAAVGPTALQLTRHNVGALRSNPRSGPALRGPSTFVSPGAFAGPPSDLQEVVVLDALDLATIWPEVEASLS